MAEKTVKICENTCEGVKFELYSDNNKNHWQTLVLRNAENGRKYTTSVAPVDFFTVASAIMCNDGDLGGQLCNMIDDFSDTWNGDALADAISYVLEG